MDLEQPVSWTLDVLILAAGRGLPIQCLVVIVTINNSYYLDLYLPINILRKKYQFLNFFNKNSKVKLLFTDVCGHRRVRRRQSGLLIPLPQHCRVFPLHMSLRVPPCTRRHPLQGRGWMRRRSCCVSPRLRKCRWLLYLQVSRRFVGSLWWALKSTGRFLIQHKLWMDDCAIVPART